MSLHESFTPIIQQCLTELTQRQLIPADRPKKDGLYDFNSEKDSSVKFAMAVYNFGVCFEKADGYLNLTKSAVDILPLANHIIRKYVRNSAEYITAKLFLESLSKLDLDELRGKYPRWLIEKLSIPFTNCKIELSKEINTYSPAFLALISPRTDLGNLKSEFKELQDQEKSVRALEIKKSILKIELELKFYKEILAKAQFENKHYYEELCNDFEKAVDTFKAEVQSFLPKINIRQLNTLLKIQDLLNKTELKDIAKVKLVDFYELLELTQQEKNQLRDLAIAAKNSYQLQAKEVYKNQLLFHIEKTLSQIDTVKTIRNSVQMDFEPCKNKLNARLSTLVLKPFVDNRFFLFRWLTKSPVIELNNRIRKLKDAIATNAVNLDEIARHFIEYVRENQQIINNVLSSEQREKLVDLLNQCVNYIEKGMELEAVKMMTAPRNTATAYILDHLSIKLIPVDLVQQKREKPLSEESVTLKDPLDELEAALEHEQLSHQRRLSV